VVDDTGLLTGRESGDPEDSVVLKAPDDGKLTEVLVKRDEYASGGAGSGQDLLVAWVFVPIARPDDVMAA